MLKQRWTSTGVAFLASVLDVLFSQIRVDRPRAGDAAIDCFGIPNCSARLGLDTSMAARGIFVRVARSNL